MKQLLLLLLLSSLGIHSLFANEKIDTVFSQAYGLMQSNLPAAIELVNELEAALTDANKTELGQFHQNAAFFFAAIGDFKNEAVHWAAKSHLLPANSDTLNKTQYKLGRAYINAGQWDAALTVFNDFEAYAIKKRDTTNVAAAYDAFATIANQRGDHKQAIKYYLVCVKIFETIENNLNLSQVYSNMAIVHVEMGETQKAYHAKRKAYDLALSTEQPYAIHKCELGLASSFNDLEKVDSAIILLKSAETYFETEFHIRFLNGVYNELGRSYMLSKNYEQSQAYFKKSIDLLRFNGYTFALPGTLVNYANVLYDLKNYSKAIETCQEAYKLVKPLNYPSLETEICGCLYNNFKENNQYDSALFYVERQQVLEDSINNIDIQKAVLQEELTAGFSSEKNTLIKDATTKIEQEASQKYYWIAGFILLFFTAAVLFWAFSQKRKANQEINREKEYLDNLLHNLVHEFRTPLTLIKGPTEELLKQDETNALLQIVNRNSEEMLQLVNQVLDFAKIKAGRLEVNSEFTDLTLLLTDLVNRFYPLANRKNITLDLNQPTEHKNVLIDADKLLKISTNLVSNAIKYSEKGSAVDLGWTIENNRLTLVVKDNGIGISEADQKRVFEKFYQVDATITRKGEGTGLGLTFVKELVDLMGGTIKLVSKKNSGTTVTVTLPIEKSIQQTAKPAEVADVENTILTEEKTENHVDQPKVLIVEDNPDLVVFLSTVLTPQNYEIHIANDGLKGYEMAREIIPDLILSDIMMPKMDGFQLVEKLKKDELTDHIPIIVLTAKASYDSMLDGLGAGADDYLSKPFKTQELLFRVSNQIKRQAKVREKFGNTPTDQPAPPLHPLIQKIEALIAADYTAHLSADQLAEKCAMSRSQLHRKLKALTGLSTSALQTKIRLTEALTTIKTTELSVSEVAYQYGYADPAHFSKQFKKEFDKNPSSINKQ